jgi:UDP-2,3-diacylglucosamine hydrolase
MTPDPTTGVYPSVLIAPPSWREIDFISDLHLQDDEPATFAAWQSFMQTSSADAVFILGDLFEVWVGDDVIEPPPTASTSVADRDLTTNKTFEARCVDVLNTASKRLAVFFIHGNRDFLISSAFAKASSVTLLNDPTRLEFAGKNWLLSHGDALCLDDTEYLAFRDQVRGQDWKQHFLAKPLQERQALARLLRNQSELRKASGVAYADVDEGEAIKWLLANEAETLIHGHTHRPADHLLTESLPNPTHAQVLQRLVLSDWDAAAKPPRAEILRLGVEHPPRRIKA